MSYSTKKVVGIFIDHKEASIINTPDHSNKGEFSIQATIHNKHHGDHGSNERTHNQKAANEMHKYFEEISNHLQEFDAILLFGFGTAQEQMRHFLTDHKSFQNKEIIVKSGDHMTDNEMIAFVRNTFKA